MTEHIDWNYMFANVKLEDDAVGDITPVLRPCPFCGSTGNAHSAATERRITMDIYTAIEYICSIDEELEAISVLLNSHMKKHEKNFKDLCDREKSLKAICKLNRAKYKDEAIDALSDVDDYES